MNRKREKKRENKIHPIKIIKGKKQYKNFIK